MLRLQTFPSFINSVSIRVFTLAVIALYALLFNIERLELDNVTILNLSNVTYGVGMLMGIGMLSFPNLARQRFVYTAALTLLGYFVMLFLLSYLDNGRPLYLFVLEIVVLLVTLFGLRMLSISLLNYEQEFQELVLDIEGLNVVPYAEGERRVNQEIYRIRRFARPIALIYCSVYEGGSTSQEIEISDSNIDAHLQEVFRSRQQQTKLARSIASLTYSSDVIIEYGNALLVCLPETNPADTQKFIEQLSRFVDSNLRSNLLIGAASYPSDGQMFEDLVQTAKGNVRVYLHSSHDLLDTDDDLSTANRAGDVLVNIDERVKIERQSEWMNKLAYQSPSARAIYMPIKRTMDTLAILGIMPLLLPLLGLIGLAIYLDDGAPIFYMQDRTGYGGKRFRMYKFRTMRVGAKPIPPKEVILPDGRKIYVWPEKTEKDPRITRVGGLLRKTSLDEIPQLLNVLRGDMSLVGPRPTTWDLEMYTLHQTERLRVRPGITGLWQVSARETKNFDERLLWDSKYIEKMSLWLDIQILWRTVAQVFKKGGV